MLETAQLIGSMPIEIVCSVVYIYSRETCQYLAIPNDNPPVTQCVCLAQFLHHSYSLVTYRAYEYTHNTVQVYDNCKPIATSWPFVLCAFLFLPMCKRYPHLCYGAPTHPHWKQASNYYYIHLPYLVMGRTVGYCSTPLTPPIATAWQFSSPQKEASTCLWNLSRAMLCLANLPRKGPHLAFATWGFIIKPI